MDRVMAAWDTINLPECVITRKHEIIYTGVVVITLV